MKEEDILKPLRLTKEERKQAGEFLGFIRICIFKNGIIADGESDKNKMITALIRLLQENEDLSEIILKAVKIYLMILENPIMGLAFEILIKDQDGHKNCNCPACTMMRATRDQSPEQN